MTDTGVLLIEINVREVENAEQDRTACQPLDPTACRNLQKEPVGEN